MDKNRHHINTISVANLLHHQSCDLADARLQSDAMLRQFCCPNGDGGSCAAKYQSDRGGNPQVPVLVLTVGHVRIVRALGAI
jgi:hypothetical protein